MSGSFRIGGHRSCPPLIMGILNVTPDSFSDGGAWVGDRAVAHAMEMVDAGADIIDVGGESTRPGAVPITVEEELSRLRPVLRDLIPSISVPVSIDTMKPRVAAECIDLGAAIVNDVNALGSPGMESLCAETGVAVVIMHTEGDVFDKASGIPGDAVDAVGSFLGARVRRAIDAGIRRDGIIIDPGLGFGKTPEQNLELLTASDRISGGVPVLIGASRKRFLSTAFPGLDRDDASAEAAKEAVMSGADIVRVHDVPSTVRAIGREPRWL